MKIRIEQEPIILLSPFKFNISVDEKPSYTATWDMSKGIVVSDTSGHEQCSMAYKFNWFKPKMLLSFIDGTSGIFTTISVWKKHYKLVHLDNVYDIYGHRKRRHSVYKDGVQVGWFQKEAIAVLHADIYNSEFDFDFNPIIGVALMLIRDATKPKPSRKSTVNIDGGSFGPFTRKFDPTWTPKRS